MFLLATTLAPRMAEPDPVGTGMGLMFTGFMFVIVLAVMAFSIGMLILWVMMLIHAATKKIENQVAWIIILVFLGGLGAIVYYFAVKRPFDKLEASGMVPPTPPTPPAPPTPQV